MPASPYQGKVLIVDDTVMDIMTAYNMSHSLGIQPVLAFDGQEALRMALKEDFDLVILDWNMPFLSGPEFLVHYESRQTKAGKPLKVVIHTGSLVPIEQFRILQKIEVLDVWHKPLRPLELLKKLNSIPQMKARAA